MGLFKSKTKRAYEKELALKKRQTKIKELQKELDAKEKLINETITRVDKVLLKGVKKLKRPKDSRALLINMELNNGFVDSFLVAEKDASFIYDQKMYIVDLDIKYWSISSKYYCLDYHEGLTIPVRRHINVDKINKMIQENKSYECEQATNPSLLKQFLMSNIIEQVIKGAELSKWLQAMRIMILVTLILSAVTLVVMLAKSGVLAGVAQ